MCVYIYIYMYICIIYSYYCIGYSTIVQEMALVKKYSADLGNFPVYCFKKLHELIIKYSLKLVSS